MLLTELFQQYRNKRLRAGSVRTLTLYEYSIRSFGISLGHDATTDDLTDDNLEMHMWRVVNEGKSKATANKDYYQLVAMWRFAHRNRLVDAWPHVRKIPEPERVPIGWLPEELNKIFVSIAREEGHIANAPASLWWRALINVLLDSGERIGAVLSLKRVHLHPNHILVPAEARKGKTRDKLFRLSKTTIDDVRSLLSHHREENIFPWDRSSTYIYKIYTTILERAGLPSSYMHKFHAIRRTVASAVAHEGGDPSAALDHSSPKVTRKYLDPRIVGQVQTADLVSKWRQEGQKEEEEAVTDDAASS
jgi:integrase